MPRTTTRQMAVALTLVFAPIPATAQDRQVPTQADLAGWLISIRPELEAELGQKLPHLPKIEFASAEQFRLARDADAAVHVKWRFPHLNGNTLALAVEDVQAGSSIVSLARLVEGTDVILVRHENARLISSWHPSLKSADSAEFLKLALVPAVVRFALDRTHNLSSLQAGCRDAEEWFALQALLEGRGQATARRVADKFGWQEIAPLLAERYRHVPDVSTDPGLRTSSQSAWQQHCHAMVKGEAFFDHLAAKKIPDLENVFVKRPRSMAMIERPELFLRDRAAKRPALAEVLARIEKTPPPGEWHAGQQALTPAMLRQVAALVGMSDRAERSLTSLQEGRTFVCSSKESPGRHVALSLLRFQSTSAARAYHELASDVQRKRDEQTGNFCGLGLRVVECKSRPVPIAGLTESVLCDRKLQGPADSPPVLTSTLLARRDDEVLEITWFDAAADVAWAESVLK